MSEFYVYMHSRVSDGKPFYIGKGRGKRAWSVKSRNAHWHNVVAKHGMKVEILHADLTEKEAFSLEKSTILLFGLANLANMTEGGEGHCGLSPSAATREKIRAANTNPSAEIRARKSAAATGRVLSVEARTKLSASKRNMSDETRRKMGDARRKWAFTEETKEKMRRAISGRKLTDEWKRKIGEAGEKPISTKSGLTFKSIKAAVEWLRANGYTKADGSSITKCAKGKLQSAYGQIWHYT